MHAVTIILLYENDIFCNNNIYCIIDRTKKIVITDIAVIKWRFVGLNFMIKGVKQQLFYLNIPKKH